MEMLLVEDVKKLIWILLLDSFFFMLLYCSFIILGCFCCFLQFVVGGDVLNGEFQQQMVVVFVEVWVVGICKLVMVGVILFDICQYFEFYIFECWEVFFCLEKQCFVCYVVLLEVMEVVECWEILEQDVFLVMVECVVVLIVILEVDKVVLLRFIDIIICDCVDSGVLME